MARLAIGDQALVGLGDDVTRSRTSAPTIIAANVWMSTNGAGHIHDAASSAARREWRPAKPDPKRRATEMPVGERPSDPRWVTSSIRWTPRPRRWPS